MADRMRALSIRQPWAWLIVNGYKDVENRTWRLPKTFMVPQRIYVHAGLKQDYDAYDGDATHRRLGAWIQERITPEVSFDWSTGQLVLGAIVGEVTVVGCVTSASELPWFEGPYGFALRDPVAYEEPIQCKGRLGFWTPAL